MGTHNLFWKNKRDLRRVKNKRHEKPSILILCEGEKTEPNYYKSFRVSNLSVSIEGIGIDPYNLVKKAVERKAEYDQIWCVFDRDDISKKKFNQAVSLAKSEKIEIAYSIECFELWYILHFEYLDAAIHRKQYFKKLSTLLNEKYKKNDAHIYNKLSDNLQKTAIKNSKKLLRTYNQKNHYDNNPSTTVHNLVMELNKYLV